MNYQEADRLKKKSLLSLIAENKFENGKSIGSSIGSAISDKFKARTTRIKKRFDPLNIIAGLTGSGVIGSSIRTVAGRAMGRNDEDISYFGGYKRKDKKKTATPLIVKAAPKSLTPIKTGDTVADSVSKLYTLMKESFDKKKVSDELKKDFAKQRKMDSDKRHREIIKAIAGISIGVKLKPEGNKKEKESGSIFDSIKNFVNGLIEKALEWLKPLKGVMSKILEFIAGKIFPKLLAAGEWLLKVLAGPEALVAALIAAALAIGYKFNKDREQTELKTAATGKTGQLQLETAFTQGLTDQNPGVGMTEEQRKEKDKDRLREANTPESLKALKDIEYSEKNTKDSEPAREKKKAELLKNAPMWVRLAPNKWQREWIEDNTKLTKKQVQVLFGYAADETTTPVEDVKPVKGSSGEKKGTSFKSMANTSAPVANASPAPQPVVTPPDLGTKLETVSKQNIDMQSEPNTTSGVPIVINGTTTNNTPGEASVESIGSSSVRNDDESLINAQRTTLRGPR